MVLILKNIGEMAMLRFLVKRFNGSDIMDELISEANGLIRNEIGEYCETLEKVHVYVIPHWLYRILKPLDGSSGFCDYKCGDIFIGTHVCNLRNIYVHEMVHWLSVKRIEDKLYCGLGINKDYIDFNECCTEAIACMILKEDMAELAGSKYCYGAELMMDFAKKIGKNQFYELYFRKTNVREINDIFFNPRLIDPKFLYCFKVLNRYYDIERKEVIQNALNTIAKNIKENHILK